MAAIVVPAVLGVIVLAIWLAKRSFDARAEAWREYAESRGFVASGSACGFVHKQHDDRDVLLDQIYAGPSGERRCVGIRVQVRPRVSLPRGLQMRSERWPALSSLAGSNRIAIDDAELAAHFSVITAESPDTVRRFFGQPAVRSFFSTIARSGTPVHVRDGMLTLEVGAQIDGDVLDIAQATRRAARRGRRNTLGIVHMPFGLFGTKAERGDRDIGVR
jgi:hypothetical protein